MSYVANDVINSVAKYDILIVKNNHVACFSMKQHFAFRKLNVPEIIQIAKERSHKGGNDPFTWL